MITPLRTEDEPRLHKPLNSPGSCFRNTRQTIQKQRQKTSTTGEAATSTTSHSWEYLGTEAGRRPSPAERATLTYIVYGVRYRDYRCGEDCVHGWLKRGDWYGERERHEREEDTRGRESIEGPNPNGVIGSIGSENERMLFGVIKEFTGGCGLTSEGREMTVRRGRDKLDEEEDEEEEEEIMN